MFWTAAVLCRFQFPYGERSGQTMSKRLGRRDARRPHSQDGCATFSRSELCAARRSREWNHVADV